MRRGIRAFSRISTSYSDSPSSWKMEDYPSVKSLQGNPALFRVMASRFPLHLRPEPQGPSHIHIAERSLLFRCLWKVGFPLESKPENQLSSRDDMGTCISLVLLQCPQDPSRLLTVFLGNVWSAIKEIKAPFVFDVEQGISLHEMQGNLAPCRSEEEVS